MYFFFVGLYIEDKHFILNITLIKYIEKRLCMESGVEAQIKYLLDNNLIERISSKKLKVKGKEGIYNPAKSPSKILTKVVGSLYKKQFPKEPKTKRTH